jgi:hypothetical protein
MIDTLLNKSVDISIEQARELIKLNSTKNLSNNDGEAQNLIRRRLRILIDLSKVTEVN